jgi:hypothetical protein
MLAELRGLVRILGDPVASCLITYRGTGEMGQDVSILFAAENLSADGLVEAAVRAFADQPPDNMVILFSNNGPDCVQRAFPAFTAMTLWADAEGGLADFATTLSQPARKVVVLTVADHSCVGGWQIFEGGTAGQSQWVEGQGYTECGLRGIELAYGIEIRPSVEEQVLFADGFLRDLAGICVFSSVPDLTSGKRLRSSQVQAIREHDLGETVLDCLLLPEPEDGPGVGKP